MDPSDSDGSPVVFVTGSSGHLGAALLHMLPQQGYRVVSLDIKKSKDTTFVGSICDRDLVLKILKGHDVKHIVHCATLHKPHIKTHSKEQFIETNVKGTTVLLEAAAELGGQIESFVFISTTSAFGAALNPPPGLPAVWIDETVTPIPKNIYGVTKLAAENMCQIIHNESNVPVMILRASRFFMENDDDPAIRGRMDDENLKVLELAYRRCDMLDVVTAVIQAMSHARRIKLDTFIISSPPPFRNDEDESTARILGLLGTQPGTVLDATVKGLTEVMKVKGWRHLPRFDRVYDPGKAMRELNWKPESTLGRAIERIANGEDWRSPLSCLIGAKGYHDHPWDVYTTDT